MHMLVTYETWNVAYQRMERGQVMVEADTGDEAVSRARIAARETGILAARIVGVEPAPREMWPAEPEPEPEPEMPAVEETAAPKGKATR